MRGTTKLDRAITLAIGHLESERIRGFGEAAHRMSFPRAFGFTGESDEQIGLVFPRALIAEALLAARAAGFAIDHKGIAEDASWLIGQKCRDSRGGWRYFPGLPELPPDADDLAAILRMLVLTRHPDVGELCDEALQIVLMQQAGSAGGFPTWIVDPADSSTSAQRMRRAIELHWGNSIDVEVVANLLHSLVVYDARRFRAEIANGVAYVIAQQCATGQWISTWYHSDFYGTFICARLLAAVAPGHRALARIVTLLASSQNADGGWGKQGSSPTDTALGLLIAVLLGDHDSGRLARVRDRAVAFLVGRQSPDGKWIGDDFIRMDTNRAMPALDDQPRVLSYRSNTVTSALCLHALSVARHA